MWQATNDLGNSAKHNKVSGGVINKFAKSHKTARETFTVRLPLRTGMKLNRLRYNGNLNERQQ